MRVLFVLALVVGILAIIGGIFYVANIMLGYHPTRGYVALAAGVILVIIGIAGFVAGRRGNVG
ncbi:MAG TPA: hypothetical protein VKX46_04835 [Ktedonobacteraceae bacterium]|jgi:uncharacterized membrane protein HdeD (DUF308 family)|nr:hypothetical protein [Ktedonobacteraceae bacterium]